MADSVLMFNICVLISHIVKWLKPQDGRSSGSLIVWFGYFIVMLVSPELLVVDEIFSRAFSYSSSIPYYGLSSIFTRYCCRVIVIFAYTLPILRILRVKKRKRIPGVTVIFKPILLGGWPPPILNFQTGFFSGLLFTWSGLSVSVWIISSTGLVCGTGSTTWDPGLSLDLISVSLGIPTINTGIKLVVLVINSVNVERSLIMSVIKSLCASPTQLTGATLIISNKIIVACNPINGNGTVIIKINNSIINDVIQLNLLILLFPLLGHGNHFDIQDCIAMLSSCLNIIEGANNNFVSKNSPLQYRNSHNIYQLPSTSFANYGNQEQLYSDLGNSFVHYPPFQSFVFLIELLQLYYVKFTKQLSLPKSPYSYVISCRGFVTVLYVSNYPHSLLRPSLECFDKRYWDSRLGTPKYCCCYTSLLTQQQLLLLLDQHTIVSFAVVMRTSGTRKPSRTARPWITLPTRKGEKRRTRSRTITTEE